MSTILMMIWLALLLLITPTDGARRIPVLGEIGSALFVVGGTADSILSHLNLPASFALQGQEEIVSAQGSTKQKFKETYNGYQVYDTTIVAEVRADGTVAIVSIVAFEDLDDDLNGKFDCENQPSDAEAEAITLSRYDQGPVITVGRRSFTDLIYVDDDDVAHFTTSVDLFIYPSNNNPDPVRLHAIIDKCDRTVLDFYVNHGFKFASSKVKKAQQSNTGDSGTYNAQFTPEDVDCDISSSAGNPNRPVNFGPNGNACIGPLRRETLLAVSTCYLENEYTIGIDNTPFLSGEYYVDITASFVCDLGYNDQRNGGFSPMLDVFYGVTRTAQLLMERYKIQDIPVKNPIPRVIAHYRLQYSNAFWSGQDLYFGDGSGPFYPLTTIDVAAHEYGHGFTEQRSGLRYSAQSGGIDEAFSDMLAQTVEEYLVGETDWLVGGKLYKDGVSYLRSMEDPTEDGSSIKHVSSYTSGMGVHHSSGVYNHVYWRIGQSLAGAGNALWPFLIANQLYWTQDTTFESGACGAMQGAYDAGIDLDVVADAFTAVGITFQGCPDISQFVTTELIAGVSQQGLTVSSVRNPLFRVVVPAAATSVTVTTSGGVRVAIRDTYKRSSVPLDDGADSATADVTGGSEVFVQLYLAEDNVEVNDVSATVAFG